MCMSKPKAPKLPPEPQAPKPPDVDMLRAGMRANRNRNAPTLLTGPGGVASGSLVTGSPTLLGG